MGAVVTFLDITDRLRLERQLAQAQKLEAIGVLAAGIAHDFNNLLTPILGYTEMALNGLAEGDPARAGLEAMLDSALRGAELTRQILAFSRKQVLEMKVLDLNEQVVSAGKMLRRLIGEDVEVRLELAGTLPSVRADPGQLQQILLNLAVNARDAMPQGGVLRVETRLARLGDGDGPVGTELPPGGYVQLRVSDSGAGMTEEIRSHIFEPFLTTKGPGKGTGLGLSTVHGIVKQHGGDISVESAPGRGASFTVYLPCAEAPAEKEGPAPAPPAQRASGRVLLVEDEPTVREFVEEALTEVGYTLTSTADPAEALEAAARSRPDLLVSDVVMPQMNGRELYRRIAEIWPGLKVLYISGYPAGSGSAPEAVEGAPLLRKPFRVSALLAAVGEVMGNGRER